MFKRFFKSIQTTRFQESIIFFTVFYIACMLFLQYKQSYFAEKNFVVTTVEKKVKRLASNIEAGLYINNFPEFNFYKNEFTMDGVIWFKFPTGTESLNTIEKFSFQNGEILSKSNPIVQLLENHVIISYHIVVKLITIVNYKHFPVSDHKLTIILQNKSVTPNELAFSSDVNNFDLSENLLAGGWTPSKQYTNSGYIKSHLKKNGELIEASFPCVVFTIDFKNENLRNFIILYLPLFLIFFLIFTSLLTKVDDISTRFPVVAGVMPILALHALVIEQVSPTGSNITKVDQMYLTLIMLSLIILLFQSYVGLTVKSFTNKATEYYEAKKCTLKMLNDIVIVFVLVCLIISLSYSTFT